MPPPLSIARALAGAFLSGEWHLRLLLARGDTALGTGGLWLRAIAIDAMQRFRQPPIHSPEKLVAFVAHHSAFYDAWLSGQLPPHAARAVVWPQPVMGEMPWPVPELSTEGALADWLHVTPPELSWFADRRGLTRSAVPTLRHYIARWIARGASLPRLLEAPKPRLKAIQRQILDSMLSRVPAHDCAHGFVPGRSVLTHASLHVGQPVVMRFDLKTFFTSVTAARALGVFRAMGYPRAVATALIGMCTTQTAQDVIRTCPYPSSFSAVAATERFHHLRALETRHLPQGAPTSPALANLAAFGLDVRCSAFAESKGLRYSRYADDLVFSGDIRYPGAISEVVRAIAHDESFRLNTTKTRTQHASARQEVTGVVVNTRLNLARDEFDRLKAVFHRARVHGPASLGEVGEVRARLLGNLSWVRSLNVRKAARLQRDFDLAFPGTT